MHTATSKVTTKGQIVIPKRIRDKYHIDATTSIKWIETENGILMVPESDDPIIAARGMLSKGILKKYLALKAREIEKEDRNRGPRR